ncbi:MAG: hypothetical protein ACOZE5_15770 [Verrucomicrobiota bacterium]
MAKDDGLATAEARLSPGDPCAEPTPSAQKNFPRHRENPAARFPLGEFCANPEIFRQEKFRAVRVAIAQNGFPRENHAPAPFSDAATAGAKPRFRCPQKK